MENHSHALLKYLLHTNSLLRVEYATNILEEGENYIFNIKKCLQNV